MPRFRLTLGRMMVVVAIVALCLGAESSLGRRKVCRERAERFHRYARAFESSARRGESDGTLRTPLHQASFLGQAEKYDRLARLCQAAEWQPWIPLPEVTRSCGLSANDDKHIFSVAEILAWGVVPVGLVTWAIRNRRSFMGVAPDPSEWN